jgi:hypothetical protein
LYRILEEVYQLKEINMKNTILLIVIIFVGVYVFYQFQEDLSPQEGEVKQLEERFEAAQKQMAQAERTASAGGIDTTSSAGIAVEKVEKIAEELEILVDRLTEEPAIQRAEELQNQIKRWLDLNG